MLQRSQWVQNTPIMYNLTLSLKHICFLTESVKILDNGCLLSNVVCSSKETGEGYVTQDW